MAPDSNEMPLWMATWITAIATLVSGCIAALIAWGVSIWATKATLQSQNEHLLHQSVMQMIQTSIEYPYLEDDDFCNKWNANRPPKTEEYQRYDNYCCIVFNLIESIWKHFHGNKNNIENFLSIEEMVIRHRQWWKNPSGTFENLDGYDGEFYQFINREYLSKLRKE